MKQITQFFLECESLTLNIVKYLKRVPLHVYMNWHYLYQDAGKAIHKYQR